MARHKQLGRQFKWSLSVESDPGVAKIGPPMSDSGIYPTADEIVQAKEDGICPRCDLEMDISSDAGLCACGFSF